MMRQLRIAEAQQNVLIASFLLVRAHRRRAF